MSASPHLLVLGGSGSHEPFIRHARLLGLRTIVVDIDPDCAASRAADVFIAHSILDAAGVLARLRTRGLLAQVAGVLTYTTLPGAQLAVADVARELGLPSWSVASVRNTADKRRMKACFERDGVPTPAAATVARLEDALAFFAEHAPVVLKPARATQGSLGVALAGDRQKLLALFASTAALSPTREVLIEAFSPGTEYSVDALAWKDEVHVYAVSRKHVRGHHPRFIIDGFSSTIGDALPEELGTIADLATRAARSLGITNSFFSADIIHTPRGPLVIECGLLLDCKVDRMLSFAGVNVYENMIRIATGHAPAAVHPGGPAGVAMKFLFAPRDGRLERDDDPRDGANTSVEWNYPAGARVTRPRSMADTLGWVLVRGADGDAAWRSARTPRPRVAYRVEES
jgi:biotin carboxylase